MIKIILFCKGRKSLKELTKYIIAIYTKYLASKIKIPRAFYFAQISPTVYPVGSGSSGSITI